MGYDRNPSDRFRDHRDNDDMDYGRDHESGRDQGHGGARDYAATGWRDREDNGRFDQRPYGGYGGREQGGQGYRRDQGGRTGDRDAGNYARTRQGPASGHRQGAGNRNDPSGYDYDDRGFIARAGDEVRSWFGDEEAERRREFDQRYDERYASATDRDYGDWRRGQISALDRDYEEYRRENQAKFQSEFASWRDERNTQRSSLAKVAEHMEVVGSDGQHVGTVDKVRGDKIVLTKTDKDAGGHHHSIPSRWIQSVDDKVTIRKTADEAQREWKDIERRTALFSDDDRADSTGPHMLNRSFSGTYRD